MSDQLPSKSIFLGFGVFVRVVGVKCTSVFDDDTMSLAWFEYMLSFMLSAYVVFLSFLYSMAVYIGSFGVHCLIYKFRYKSRSTPLSTVHPQPLTNTSCQNHRQMMAGPISVEPKDESPQHIRTCLYGHRRQRT